MHLALSTECDGCGDSDEISLTVNQASDTVETIVERNLWGFYNDKLLCFTCLELEQSREDN